MATLEITTRIGCSVGCSFCPQVKLAGAYPKDQPRVMSLEVFRTCVEKLPREVNIDFAGMAEPWLNPDCSRMLLHAHTRGHTIGVYTTLQGMTIEDIDAIQHVPFRAFEVHLPSIEGSENIKVDDHYIALVDRLRQGPIAANFHYFESEAHPTVQLLLTRTLSRRKKHTRAGNVDVAGVPLPSRARNKGHLACRRQLDYNILLPNGDVALCCMDYGMEHIIGNLLHSDYAELFRSASFERVERGLVDETLETLCRSCERHVYSPSAEEQRQRAALASQGLNPNLSAVNVRAD